MEQSLEYFDLIYSILLGLVGHLSLNLSPLEMIIGSVLTLLSLLLLVGLGIFTLIANKRARVFGVFAWIAAAVGMAVQWIYVVLSNSLCGFLYSILFNVYNFARFAIIKGEPPYDTQILLNQVYNPTVIVLVALTSMLPWIFYVCMTLMAIYSGRQLKAVKKGFALFAMIACIAHAALMFMGLLSPVFILWPSLSVLQLIWTVVYNLLLLLPAVLLAVQGVFVILDHKKKQAEILANTVEISDIEE